MDDVEGGRIDAHSGADHQDDDCGEACAASKRPRGETAFYAGPVDACAGRRSPAGIMCAPAHRNPTTGHAFERDPPLRRRSAAFATRSLAFRLPWTAQVLAFDGPSGHAVAMGPPGDGPDDAPQGPAGGVPAYRARSVNASKRGALKCRRTALIGCDPRSRSPEGNPWTCWTASGTTCGTRYAPWAEAPD